LKLKENDTDSIFNKDFYCEKLNNHKFKTVKLGKEKTNTKSVLLNQDPELDKNDLDKNKITNLDLNMTKFDISGLLEN